MGDGGDKKKVLVAIDESECSRYALDWTLQNLLHTLHDSKLFIFTAQPIAPFSFVQASTYGALPGELITSLQENHRKTAEALLDMAKQLCSQYGVTAETFTDVGEPKEMICDAVERHGIGLLVIGSHGRKGLQRFFLGSVSNYCVHNAQCPVLVVKMQ